LVCLEGPICVTTPNFVPIGQTVAPPWICYTPLNHSIWYRFRDIATFTVYVTGCDLQKSFGFEKTVETTSHVRFSIHV